MMLQLHEGTRRKLERLPEVLKAEFPDETPGNVELEVSTIARDMLADARIEDFVPVLVHRFAREHLLERNRDAVASGSWPTSEGPS